MNRKTMTTMATIFLAALSSGPGTGFAHGAEPATISAEASVSILSKYVWRGYELSKDSLVIQPSLTMGYQGFGCNLWGNLDTDQDTSLFDSDGANWNETDMTLSYEGSYDKLGYTVGYIYYALDGAEDTQEIYGALSLDVITTPTLTVYRDIATFPGWYITLELSHSLDLTEDLTLDIGGKLSYLAADDASTLADPDDPGSAYSDWHDGVLSVSLGYALNKQVTMTAEIDYSFALGSDARDILEAASGDGDDADYLYGGITASFSF